MNFHPDFNNYIAMENIHVFINFTRETLEYATQSIDDLSYPIFHIFMTTSHPDSTVPLEEFLRYRIKICRTIKRPANVTIYRPEWNSRLGGVVSEMISGYPFRASIKISNGLKFALSREGMEERLLVEYPKANAVSNILVVGYNRYDDERFNPLGVFPVDRDEVIVVNPSTHEAVKRHKLSIGDIVYFDIAPANSIKLNSGEYEFKVGTVTKLYSSDNYLPYEDLCTIVQPSGNECQRFYNEDISTGRMSIATDTMSCSPSSAFSVSHAEWIRLRKQNKGLA